MASFIIILAHRLCFLNIVIICILLTSIAMYLPTTSPALRYDLFIIIFTSDISYSDDLISTMEAFVLQRDCMLKLKLSLFNTTTESKTLYKYSIERQCVFNNAVGGTLVDFLAHSYLFAMARRQTCQSK